MLLGAAWQRCRRHSLRGVLDRVPRGNAEMVAAICSIFAQPDVEPMDFRLDVVAGMRGCRSDEARP